MTIHPDPFDLDDHRPRVATELDSFIAAGVREAEQAREAEDRERVAETCPACAGEGDFGQGDRCDVCEGAGFIVYLEGDTTGVVVEGQASS